MSVPHPWQLRPLTLRHPEELRAWGVPDGARGPWPARVLLISGPRGEALAAPLCAALARAGEGRGVTALPCEGGILLAGADRSLASLAEALESTGDLAPLGEALRGCLETLTRPPQRWQTHRGAVDLSRPLLMGIVNVTPDSFYDGGRYPSTAAAVDAALRLVDEGADLLDIGGESTRPGAAPVDAEEERRRVTPVIAALARQTGAPLSVDTSKMEVAADALEAGAWILNDVWSFKADPRSAALAASWGCGVVLMHGRGDSRTMGHLASYRSLMGEIGAELSASLATAAAAGVEAERVVLDPGIGFAKVGPDNLRVLRHLPELAALGRPLLVGASRKSFLKQCFGYEIEDRLEGSLAAAAAALSGGARVIRVHDVRQTRRLLDVLSAIEGADPGEAGLNASRSG